MIKGFRNKKLLVLATVVVSTFGLIFPNMSYADTSANNATNNVQFSGTYSDDFTKSDTLTLNNSEAKINLKINKKGMPTGFATEVYPTPTLGSSAGYTIVNTAGASNTGIPITQYTYNTETQVTTAITKYINIKQTAYNDGSPQTITYTWNADTRTLTATPSGSSIAGTISGTTLTGDFIGNNGGYSISSAINAVSGNFIGNTDDSGWTSGILNFYEITSVTGNFIGNVVSGTAMHGPIYNTASSDHTKIGAITTLTGDFIGNKVTSTGGAIFNGRYIDTSTDPNTIHRAEIGSIEGDFITNTADSSGGAIYNLGDIGNIHGNFVNNNAANNGGAIYNYEYAIIASINGNFMNNNASDNKGGAIYNREYGTITSINGNFINNSAYQMDGSSKNTLGGAIYNDGTIGDTSDLTKTAISGIFKGNYSTFMGGAIYNHGRITKITGTFGGTGEGEGNRTIYGASYGGAIQNQNRIDTIIADFIGNSSPNGGAIRNESNITTINGNFTSNSASSTGGGIFNDWKIKSITGNFTNNSARAGGAINNSGTIGDTTDLSLTAISGTFKGNVASTTSSYSPNGGAINNEGRITKITGTFGGSGVGEGNTAHYGGAIYNSADAQIDSISANFTNNKAYNEKTSSLGYGGAIYNKGVISSIVGDFTGNSADTVDGNGYGGAIYNTGDGTHKGTIGAVTGNFTNNSASGMGGAIYNWINTELSLVAGTSSILFENNTDKDGYNDVHQLHSDSTTNAVLNLNANTGKNITFNGTITGSGGYYGQNIININNGSSNVGGSYIFNNKISGNSINIYNGANIKLGSKTQANSTTTYGLIDLSDTGYVMALTNDTHGGTIDMQNGNYADANHFGKMTLGSALNIKMDIDASTTTPTSDTITVKSGSSGVLNINSIYFKGVGSTPATIASKVADGTIKDFTLQILSGNDENTYLTIDSTLKSKFDYDFTDSIDHGGVITPTTSSISYTDQYGESHYNIRTQKSLSIWGGTGDTDNGLKNALKFNTIETHVNETVATAYDNLAVINTYSGTGSNNRSISFAGIHTDAVAHGTYTMKASTALGTTTAGKMTLAGVLNAAGDTRTTVNLNGNAGYNLTTNATELVLQNLELKNASGDTITVGNSNSKVTLNNSKVTGNITGTTSGSTLFNLTSSNTSEVTGNVTKANIVNTGNLTLGGNVSGAIKNDATLTLKGGTLGASITNSSGISTARTVISGNVAITDSSKSIGQAINITSGSLTTSAASIGGTVTNNVANGLVLNGGTLAQNITMTGTTGSIKIAGNVSVNSSKSIGQAINIASGSLTANAASIGGTVTNNVANGLVLNGGTLAQNITGTTGSTKIAAGSNTVTNNATISQAVNVVTGTFNNTNTGTVSGALTVSNGASATNTGTLGAVTNSGTFRLKGGTLTSYSQSSGSLSITNGASLSLTDGSNTITGGNVTLGATSPASVGSLVINNGLTTNAAKVTTNGASNLTVKGGSTFTTQTNSNIGSDAVVTLGDNTTTGTLNVNTGSVNLGGNDSWTSNGTVNVAGGTLNLAGATQNGTFTQTSGTTNITSAQTLGTGTSITGGTVNINDDLTLTAGTLNAATTVIAANKNLNIQGGTVTLDGIDGTTTTNVNWLGDVNLSSGSLVLRNIIDTTRDSGSGHNKEGKLNATGGTLNINNSNVLLGASDLIADNVNLVLAADVTVSDNSTMYVSSNSEWSSGNITVAGGTVNLNNVTTVNGTKSLIGNTGTLNFTGTTNTLASNSDTIASAVATTIGSDLVINNANATGVILNGSGTGIDTWNTNKITLTNGKLTLDNITKETSTTLKYSQTGGTLKLDNGTSLTLKSGSSITGGTVNIDPSILIFDNGVANSAIVTMTDDGSVLTVQGIDADNITTLNMLDGSSISDAGTVTIGDGTVANVLNIQGDSIGSTIAKEVIMVVKPNAIVNITGTKAALTINTGDTWNGNINQTAGTLTVLNTDYTKGGNLTSNGGAITIGDGTTASSLLINNASDSIAAGTTVTLTANSKLAQSAGSITLDNTDSWAASTGAIELTGGTLELNGRTDTTDAAKTFTQIAGTLNLYGSSLTLATNASTITGGTVNLGSSTPATIGSLILQNSSNNVAEVITNGTGANALTIGNGTDTTSLKLTNNSEINSAAALTVAAASKLDINSTKTGSTGIVIDATNDTWSGEVDLTGGTLTILGNNAKTGHLDADTGNLNIGGTLGAGTLNLNNANDDIAAATVVTIAANGTLNQTTGNAVINTADTWSGAISHAGGTLELNGRTDTTDATKTFTQTAGTTNLYGSSLTLGTSSSTITGGTVNLGSSAPATTGSLILQNTSNNVAEVITNGTGANVLTIGNGTDTTSLKLTNNSEINKAAVVTVAAASTLEVNGTSANGVNINGGTTGSDTWNGNINVTGGKLNISDNASKAATATLTQTGTSTGTININGSFTFGNNASDAISAGTLNIGDGSGTNDTTLNVTGGTITSGASNAKVVINSDATMNITGGTVTLDGGTTLSQVDWQGNVLLNGGSLILANIVDQSRATLNNKTGKLTANTGNLTIDATSVLLGDQDTIADAVTLVLNTTNLYIGKDGDETANVYIGSDDTWNGVVNLANSGSLTLDGTTTTTGTNSINATGGTLNLVNTGTTGHGSATGITFNSTSDKLLYAATTTVNSDLTINAGQIQLDDTDTLTSGKITLSGGQLDLSGISTANTQLDAQTGSLNIQGAGKTTTLNNSTGDSISKAVATTIDAGSTLKINGTNANVTLDNTNDTWNGALELSAGNLTFDSRSDNLTGATQTYNQNGGNLTLLDSSLTLANNASKITGGNVALTSSSGTSAGSQVLVDNGLTTNSAIVTSDTNANNALTVGGTNGATFALASGSNVNKDTDVTIAANGTLKASGDSIKGGSTKNIVNDGTFSLTNDGTTAGTISRAVNNASNDGTTGSVNLTGTTLNTAAGSINQANITIGDNSGAAGSNTSTFTMGADVTANTLLTVEQDGKIVNAANNITAESINIKAGGSIAGDSTTEGNFTVNNGGTNAGNISQNDITLTSGTLHNTGSMTSNGTFTNTATIDNSGTEGAGTLNVSNGTNTGTITQGNITISNGNTGFDNNNTIIAENKLDNKGTFNNYKNVTVQNSSNSANLTNSGTINNPANTTITANTLTNNGGTINLTNSQLSVTNQNADINGVINVLGSNPSTDKSNLSIAGTQPDFAGTLNVGDSTNKTTLNLQSGNLTENAVINLPSGSVLNVDDSSSAGTSSLVLNPNDTYSGDVTLASGNVKLKDMNLTVGNAPTVSGGTSPYYAQTGGTLELNNTNLTMPDSSKISGGNLALDSSSVFNSLSNSFSVNNLYNAGLINSINGTYENYAVSTGLYAGNGTTDNQGNFAIDLLINGSNVQFDSFGSDSATLYAANGSTGVFNISDINLNGNVFGDNAPTSPHITIGKIFKGNVALGQNIIFTATSKEILTPIGWYRLNGSGNGTYSFDLTKYNPQVYRGQITTLAQYQNQLVIGDMLFNHTMLDNGFKGNDYISTNPNLYASASDLYAPYQYSRKDGGIWVKTYGTFEKLNMNHGLKVGNNAYGTLIGVDFGLIDLSHGWQFMPTAYLGYNGAHQYWNGIGAYQNGGQAGFLGTWYKDNFMIGTLAYGGVYGNQMDTPRGTDDAFNYFAGGAVKTAYNWRFAKDWSLQPNLLVAYNFFGQENWHTDFGQMGMMSGMLHGINIAPGLNLIWEKETFSTYLTLQYMYNVNQSVGGKAGNTQIPNVHMDRGYIQYGIGINKKFSERFSGYLQAVIRNVGRNGIGLQAGFQIQLGKDNSKGSKKSSATGEAKPTKVVIKKCK